MNMFLLLMSLYLLGSARGTSGQPDELSGSIDHQTSVQQLPGEQPSGEQPSGEHLSGEQPLSEHESGEQPSDEQPSGEHASGEQPSGEHASGEQSLGEHALSEKPSGEQASGAPISSTSTGEPRLGTILNCYTCAYMNDRGRCLRGEGTCITQNSQQCMLKKIFEGGKLQFMVLSLLLSGGKLQFMVQGCENMCPSMNLFSHGTRMQIICCRNQSFCNKI
ncbi:acrosomal protein SP-10 isoform X8 [Pongo abelii]|uniref:acrosomal protein SP-10 isoform X8 n=1 Tax=Pongo abelii TaxID=9601 RepID=UPI0023E7D2C5|nr:acrosomal protein SP-10 isoform X8 [Pongo abelii]